jgi:outer membrane protein TolC
MKTLLISLVALAALRASAGTPPGLPDLIRDALEHNLDLLVSRQNLESARGGVTSAEGQFDPSLSLSPQWAWNRQTYVPPPLPGYPAPGGNTTGTDTYTLGLNGTTWASTSYSLNLQAQRTWESAPLLVNSFSDQWNSSLTLGLTQPLLKGFGRTIATAPVEEAKLALGSADALVREQAGQVVGQVEQAYAQFEYAAAGARLAAASLERADKLRNRVQEQVKVGVLTRLDLLSAEEGVANRQATLASARLARANAVDTLLEVVYGGQFGPALRRDGLRLEADPAGPPALLAPPALPPVEDCETEALAQRQAIQAAQLNLGQSRLQLRVARNNLKPTLNLTGSYGMQGLNNATDRLTAGTRPLDRGLAGWTVGVTLGMPLFNRAAQGAASTAAAQVRLQELAVQTQEEQIRLVVRQAHHGILAAQDQLASAERARQLSQERYEGEVARLALSLSDTFRVLQMEEQLTSDELTAAQARMQLETAVSGFLVATGRAADPFLR